MKCAGLYVHPSLSLPLISHHHHCQIGSLSPWQRSTGGVCQLEAESIGPQLASQLETSTLHHALSGMEEKDKKENVCICIFLFACLLTACIDFCISC